MGSARPAFVGRNVAGMKAHNVQTVLLTLLQYGAVPRVRLARHTGLSTTTVSNLVAELLTQGVVAELGHEQDGERRAGRPRTLLQLVPDARFAAAIHVDVDHLRVGVCNLVGEIKGWRVMRPDPGAPAEQVLADACTLLEEVIGETCPDRTRLVGLGAGASGLVDPIRGLNRLAPNLGWHDLPLREMLSERLKLPVCVDNNVRGMALAESMFGAGRGISTLAFVYSHVGVGAGFIVDGQVYRGGQAGAGEIGHTTSVPDGGLTCRCGNTGCLETLVSEPAIMRAARGMASRDPDSLLARLIDRSDAGTAPVTAVFQAARGGDRMAHAILLGVAHHTGTALANLVNLINPELIILGGLFADGQDLLLPHITETMRRRSFAGLGERVQVCPTSFGPHAGLVGAAVLALDAFFYRQTGPGPAAWAAAA